MGYQFPTQDELTPSEDELARARKAAAAPGQDTAIGGGAGTVLGGALGALLSIPLGFGATAPALIPAGAGIGGALGSAIGGTVGGNEATGDNAALDAAELERQKKIAQIKLRQEALDELEHVG